jgi:hypothetical protein
MSRRPRECGRPDMYIRFISLRIHPTYQRILDNVENRTQNSYMVCNAECTEEYKAKFYEYAEGLKTGKVKYAEEFILDRAAGTVQCFVIVNGQRIEDHGVVKVGVVNDHVFDDGRPTKVSNVTT